MRLRAKTILVTCLAGLTFFLLVLSVEWFIIAGSYTQIEEETGRRSVEAAENVLRREHDTLHVLAQDYAGWDDAYRYIQDRNRAFEESNLVEEGFSGLHMSFMAFLNQEGSIVFAKWFDRETGKFAPIPPDVFNHISERDGLTVRRSPDDAVHGILETSEGLLLVASEPIIKSDKTGPVMGTLIMGRLVDRNLVQSLSRILNRGVDILPLNGGTDPVFLREQIMLDACPCNIRVNDDEMVTYSVLRDVHGAPTRILRVASQRSSFQVGRLSLVTTAIAFGLGVAGYMLLMFLLLRRFVTDPVGQLANAVHRIRPGATRIDPGTFHTGTNDEIATLGAAFFDAYTELNHHRVEIERQRSRLSAILNASVEGIVVLDTKRHIVLANPAFARMIGLKLPQIQGQKFGEFISFAEEKTLNPANELLDRVMRTGSQIAAAESGPLVLFGKKQIPLPVSVSIAPLNGQEEAVQGCVLSIHDATIERELERRQSDFVSVASHQLRSPLTSIKWGIELLRDGFPYQKKAFHEQVDDLEKVTNQMVVLVNELLRVSRIDAGKLSPLKLVKTDVVTLLEEVLHELEPFRKERNVRIKLDIAEKSMMASVDPTQFALVFSNIINNAIKYSPIDSEVQVSLHLTARLIKFSVTDAGFGIPKKQQHRIFDRLFRADNVMTKVEGTGLGLYIAKDIVTQHHGEIWFESKEGKGTTFFVTIPRGH